jgi:2,3,4,5-tetrahydropyridine-2-carboxylate N-succinyltransferase
MTLFSFGIGIGTRNAKGEWLEVYFPRPLLKPAADEVQPLATLLGYSGGNQTCLLTTAQRQGLARSGEPYSTLAEATKPLVAVFLATDQAPAAVPEVYLKLALLSHRLVKPHGTNLAGLFKLLPNVAWTSQGPVDLAELPAMQLASRVRGDVLTVHAVDKFPPMLDYVVPAGVRVADGARVRLGAHLGAGTTVMHEGFVNFNGGTEGPNMVEGRISAGVYAGAGTDLGGGCSTMGTLSGGGEQVITLGKRCLLGANSGLGIPLGDDCTVEAGLYLTAASKVRILDPAGKPVKTMKARDLAGRSGLLFRRNSLDGAVECLPNKAAIALNQDLHKHN